MVTSAIDDVITPLAALDPGAGDHADLEVLRGIVGDARVVGLGETAHFASEPARLRDRIFRFLVEELGFTTLVLESGLPEGLAVDRWVRGGPGELADVARDGITYAHGRCAEAHEALRWMRARAGVGFAGMDVPGWCADPGPGVAACLDRLDPRPGDDDLRMAARLGTPARGPAPETSGAAPAGLAERIDELVARAEDAGDDVARRCARGARRVVEFLEHGLYPGPGRNLRNEVMAENLRRLLDRDPDARLLVGAHNVHLQRSPSFDGTAPIGALLGDLGGDVVLIGTTRGGVAVPDLDVTAPPERRYVLPGGDPVPAPAGTLDALLDAAGPAVALADLRRAAPGALDGVTAMQGAHGIDVAVDPRRAFDAVVHLRTITPAHGVAD